MEERSFMVGLHHIAAEMAPRDNEDDLDAGLFDNDDRSNIFEGNNQPERNGRGNRSNVNMVAFDPVQDKAEVEFANETANEAYSKLRYLRRAEKKRRAKRRRLYIANEQEDILSEAGESSEEEMDQLLQEEDEERRRRADERLRAAESSANSDENRDEENIEPEEDEILELTEEQQAQIQTELRNIDKTIRKEKCNVCKIRLIDPDATSFIGQHVNQAIKIIETGYNVAGQDERINSAVKTINEKVVEPTRNTYNLPTLTIIDFMRHYGIGKFKGAPCVINDELQLETSLISLEQWKNYVHTNCVYMMDPVTGEKSIDVMNSRLMFTGMNLQRNLIKDRRQAEDCRVKRAEKQSRQNEYAPITISSNTKLMALTGAGLSANTSLRSLSKNVSVPSNSVYLIK